MVELRTERLHLRPLTLADAERVTEVIDDPRIYEMVARIRPGQTVEETGRWITSVERGADMGTEHVFAIIRGGTLVGSVGAHRRDEDQPFEIGYWIAPDAWGEGIATEAARALVEWLESRGQAGELTSGHFVDNPASGRVLEKLGFRERHRAPVYCLGRDREVDHVFMARTAPKG